MGPTQGHLSPPSTMRGEGLQGLHCSPQGLGSESPIVPGAGQGPEREGAFPTCPPLPLHISLAPPHLPSGLGWGCPVALRFRPGPHLPFSLQLGFGTESSLPVYSLPPQVCVHCLGPTTEAWHRHGQELGDSSSLAQHGKATAALTRDGWLLQVSCETPGIWEPQQEPPGVLPVLAFLGPADHARGGGEP